MLSASVLEELAQASGGVLRKMHACVACDSLSYIDDINVVTGDTRTLEACILLVLEFVATFRLSLSHTKTMLWGTSPAPLRSLVEKYGLGLTAKPVAWG